jgi:hypothetical protein
VVECEVIASFGAPDGIKLDDCLGSSDDRRDREIATVNPFDTLYPFNPSTSISNEQWNHHTYHTFTGRIPNNLKDLEEVRCSLPLGVKRH